MRKLLLATSALLGASAGFAGLGYAGTLQPNAPNPAPGSITVTLNALVEAFIVDGTDSGTLPQNNNGNKTATYGIADYARLYPSFDGVLANGLKYGGSIEIRQNQGFSGTGTGGPSDAGSTYIQREFIYIGADKFGKVSVGSPVQPTELFQEGNPANFNTGGWDGDLPGIFNTGIPYFIDDDADRANKIVYVSPQFAGFDFGVSFEPNAYGNDYAKAFTRASSTGSTTTTDVITGADTTTESSQYGKRRNTVDGAARYQGTFGAIGIKADVGGSYGGTVHSNGGTADGIAVPAGARYKNFSLLAGGLAGTFGGLEVDGHIDYGAFGPDLSPTLTGHTTAYIVGASYTIGPVIFGGSYYGFDSGYTRTATTGALHGYGIAAGGTYTLAPGASVFLEYLYGHQHVRGLDLVGGSSDTTANNNTRSQGFGLGTAFKW